MKFSEIGMQNGIRTNDINQAWRSLKDFIFAIASSRKDNPFHAFKRSRIVLNLAHE